MAFMSGNLCYQNEHHVYPALPSNGALARRRKTMASCRQRRRNSTMCRSLLKSWASRGWTRMSRRSATSGPSLLIWRAILANCDGRWADAKTLQRELLSRRRCSLMVCDLWS
jgi:hypothetical protein